MEQFPRPIEVHTEYSYREMKRFQRFAARRLRYYFTVLFAVVACIYLLALYGLRGPVRQRLSTLGPIAWLLALLLLLIAVSMGLLYTRRANALYTRLLQNGERFIFREGDFTILAEQPDCAHRVDMHYGCLYRVWETKDMFYLYINPRQAYLVSKAGFLSSAPHHLRAIFQRQLPPGKFKLRGVG